MPTESRISCGVIPAARRSGSGMDLWLIVQGWLTRLSTSPSRLFARASPSEIVLADPVGSILVDVVEVRAPLEAASWLVERIGEDFVPEIADLSRVGRAYAIDDAEAFAAARALFKAEGVLAGSSMGTLLAAALKHCREQLSPVNVPPDPTPQTTASTAPTSCSKISGPVPRSCASGLAGLPN
jgi:hypothetical protein